MKKSIFLLLSFLSPIVVNAYDALIDGIYYNFSGDNAIVTYRDYYYNSYSGDVVIPETVTYDNKTYTVTSIGTLAFAQCTALTSITIPNSVTDVGVTAFQNCSNLSSVTANCPIVGNYFSDHASIETISIGPDVESIDASAFSGCSGLETVTFSTPSKVASIGSSAFNGCSNLTSIDIPNSVESIGGYAFAYCINATTINIGSSVSSVGSSAFYGCTGIKHVSVNCPTVEKWFQFCTYIEKVTIGPDVESIDASAFYGCTGLETLIFSTPSKVESIGNCAFYGCTNLSSINIPNSVKRIDYSAFNGCTNLSSITLHGGSIGIYAFAYCTNLTEFYNHGKLNNDGSRDLGTIDHEYVFQGSSIGAATLYVTPNALEQAQNNAIWSQFGNIRMFIPDGYPTPTSETLTDGDEYLGYDEKVILEDITYTRTFGNTNWQAMYLPFEMEYSDWSADFDIARINDVHQFDDDDDGDIDRTILEVIKLKNGSTTDANTPYVIRAKSTGEKTITKTNTMLHKAVEKTFDVSSWLTLFNFVGTYKPILASVVASKGYLVLGDGSLHPMDSNSSPLKSYRWYLRVTDRDGNDKQVNAVRLHILDDGEETDIGMLTADNDSGQEIIHDLSGRRISNSQFSILNSQLPKGIYIINGKKIYVK